MTCRFTFLRVFVALVATALSAGAFSAVAFPADSGASDIISPIFLSYIQLFLGRGRSCCFDNALTLTFTSTRVSACTLTAHGQSTLVAHATISAQFNQTLDI